MAQGRKTWRTLIARHGMNCDLIRVQTGISDLSVTVRMMRQYATEDPLIHEVAQRGANFIVEYDQLVDTGYPWPPQKNDRVKSLGKFYTVDLVEPKASYGELTGWKLSCTGGS